METRINVKLEFNRLVVDINELEFLNKSLNRVGPLVDRLTRELENEEQKIKLYKLKGTYSDNKFRLAMLIRGVSLNEIYKLKALPISDNVTIVGPIPFIEKTEEQHQKAQYYNDLLLNREQILDDIKQALKRLEYVKPNDLKFSGVTVLEWLDMNVIALVKLQVAIQENGNAKDVKEFRKILQETMLGVLYLTKFRDALLDDLKQVNNGAYRCLAQSLHDRPKELYSTLNGFKNWIDKLTASQN